MPPPGSVGYHMGFPGGQPTLVISELLGAARARRGAGQDTQPVLAWAEHARFPMGDGTLSGIRGGSVFAGEDRNRVVEGKRVSVRVGLGGRRIDEKTNNIHS